MRIRQQIAEDLRWISIRQSADRITEDPLDLKLKVRSRSIVAEIVGCVRNIGDAVISKMSGSTADRAIVCIIVRP